MPSFVAPEYDLELGMAHGVTPEARGGGAPGERPTRDAVFLVSPTYYGMVADVAGCAEVCHAAGVPLVVDQAWGPHFGFHPDLPAERGHARRRRGADLDAQDRRLAHAERDAARRRRRAHRHRRRRPGDPAAALDVAVARCCSRRWTRRGGSSRCTARRSCTRRSRRVMRTRAKLDDGPRPRARRREPRRAPRRRGLGSDADRDRRPRHRVQRLRGRRCAARSPTTSSPSWPRTRRSCSSSAPASGPRRSSGWRATSTRRSKRIARPGKAAGARPAACRAGQRDGGRAPRRLPRRRRDRRRRRCGRADLVRVDRRLPARASRRCCRASGSPPRRVAYLRELVASGARLHGASDPAFATINVLSGP